MMIHDSGLLFGATLYVYGVTIIRANKSKSEIEKWCNRKCTDPCRTFIRPESRRKILHCKPHNCQAAMPLDAPTVSCESIASW